MQNDPNLHHDRQNQADHLIKTKGSKKAAEFANEEEENVEEDGLEKSAGEPLSDAEKADQTDPKDFEPFNLDKLDKLNEGEE